MSNAPDPLEPPLVLLVPAPAPPRPGLFEAVILTLGFGAVLFGTVFAVVGIAMLVLAWRGGLDALTPPEGAATDSAAAIPPDLIGPLAWSFPAGYAAGLSYAVLVFRWVGGRNWAREAGLVRLPLVHLLLGVLALPGFVVVSDLLGGLLSRVFGMEQLMQEQARGLGDLFHSFHWSFAVLAAGVGPGLVEELWCRGFLGRGLVGRYGWVRGILAASVFFGLLHAFPPPYVLVTAMMGAGLHFAYSMSRSLWVPIVMHLLNNSFAVLVAVRAIPGERLEFAGANAPPAVVPLAIALLICCGAAMWSARARLEGKPLGASPHQGVLVPPTASGLRVVDRAPNVVWVVCAVGCCLGLLWTVLG